MSRGTPPSVLRARASDARSRPAARVTGRAIGRRSRLLVAGIAVAVALAGCSSTGGAPHPSADASRVATSAPAGTPFELTCDRATGGVEQRFSVDGVARTVLVHVPTAAARGPVPLVLAFPGRGESARLMASYTGLDALDAVVVIADGLPGTGGKTSWEGTPFSQSGTNDLDLVRSVIDGARASGCIDPSSIALTGKSDGGGFAELVACDPAFRITALVTAAAAFSARTTSCRPQRPISVITLHGTADDVVPIDGSAPRHLLSEDAVDRQFARLDRCTGRRSSQSSADTIETWSGCADGVLVQQYRLDGDGHTWPGAKTSSGPGPTSTAVSATALIASALHRAAHG